MVRRRTVDTNALLRHQAAIDEIERYLGDVETFAVLRNDNAQMRALLEAIVAETKLDDGARMVAIGGGWRRLPDDLAALINEAAALVTNGNR
jgi:hypothetical protein